MKIGIIGAYGKAGSLISKEAINRGHEVIAFVRDKKKAADMGFAKVKERDLFSLDDNDVDGLDALVCAVSLPSSPENDNLYQKAMGHLIDLLKHTDTRLLVVGGAASLYTDPQRKHPLLESIPEKWRAVPADMAKAFAMLQDSKVNWTFFSPALMFDPKGLRTGKYTVGSDYVITNASNESYISYEDYAVAMVDEIENGFHIRSRFTAVSDSKPEAAAEKPAEPQEKPVAPSVREDGYYGILKKKPQFYGLSRYCPPLNFELAGKQFRLVLDREGDYFVNFLTGTTLEWSKYTDGAIRRERYECLKIDDLTYFVKFELTDYSPRTNISLILDMEQRLLTFVRTYTGFNERYPYLVESDFDFGAINIPGYPLPLKRHGYTTDLVGKRVNWTYGPDMSIVHVYYNPHYIRATFLPGTRMALRPITPEEREERERFPYDEPTTYIKVKEGIYIVSVIEQNRSKRGDTGNTLLFLMDLVHVHDVGMSFGHTPPSSGAIKPENYFFAAYGDFVYSDGVIESQKNIYLE